MKCPMCTNPCFMDCPKESVETKEEWIKSASTEELAEWINNKMLEAYHDGRNGWTPRFSKIKTEKWLREKHE